MGAPLAGFDCVLTAGAHTVGKAQDVELTMSATEIDVTTRSSSGWKEFIQGLKEWGVTIDLLWIPSDTALQAVRDAYLNGTTLAIVLNDDSGNGFSGTCIVTGLTNGQALDDGVGLPATLKGTGALTPNTGS